MSGSRRKPGPLGPFVDGYGAWLVGRGYSPSVVVRSLVTLGHLGRWLERNSDVLVLIEPTRGVDVGARQDIYAALRKLAADGMAVLIATSDYEEAVQVADRAYVMAKGRIVTELSGAAVTSARLLEASGG